ncbi:ATP-binding cassette domain-containing protein [Macrococcus armenti]|uniref:ATP-binding cassette domain-containing protein n=1 Tax=Macrococcus armenti TaxID=2875764 RepID=UPI001CC920A6|nr:ATP-binding cassette domain-containing protein [Macrococcus armenti]UBH12715.1 ATP-binding cassette domain-containing protein [Macrococcus armenti]UBH21957.1 ATP-binding cassette domain-containing protein [Macrococcus armenti]
MTSEILVRLLNVTKYFRQVSGFQKFRDFMLPESKNHIVEVKDVTIHLYRGEILALVGLPNSGKSIIGKLMAKVVEPNSGRVKNEYLTFLASHNHIFEGVSSVRQLIESIFLTYNLPLSEYNERRKRVVIFAELEGKEKVAIQDLTTEERTKLLVSLAYFIKPDVIIFDELYQYMDDNFKEKFHMVIDMFKKEQRAIVLIDSNMELIESRANYITWMSHGQVKKSGMPSEVLPQYKNYVSDYKSCRTDEERELFDLQMRMSRSLNHDKDEKLSRIKKYGGAIFDETLQRTLMSTLMLLLGITVMFLLLINDIGMRQTEVAADEKGIVEKTTSEFREKYAIGVTNKEMTLKGDNSVKLPAGITLTISSIGDKTYKVDYQKKTLEVAKQDITYINPAALYDEYTFNDLEDYMYGNYANYREFFNGYLGKSHKVINSELYPESNDRFKIKLTKNDIYLHFNDNDVLNGISFPMVNKDKLKQKYKINTDQWIIKLDNGYAIADFSNNEWLIIKM